MTVTQAAVTTTQTYDRRMETQLSVMPACELDRRWTVADPDVAGLGWSPGCCQISWSGGESGRVQRWTSLDPQLIYYFKKLFLNIGKKAAWLDANYRCLRRWSSLNRYTLCMCCNKVYWNVCSNVCKMRWSLVLLHNYKEIALFASCVLKSNRVFLCVFNICFSVVDSLSYFFG